MASLELPLFPLETVLFPEGRLALHVFEQRYLDMVSRCMKAGQPFGITLIRSGPEVGVAAAPQPVGSLAHIVEWDMPRLGILALVVRGGRRFRIESSRTGPDQLVTATVSLLPEEPDAPLPEAQRPLAELLHRLLSEIDEEAYFQPPRLDEAAWVANRLAEFLPLRNRDRQGLLMQDRPESRLAMLSELIKTLAGRS